MKSICLTLSLLIGGLLITPAAFAQQYGMDTQFQDSMGQQSQAQSAQAAQNSGAATGTQAYTTTENAWQDMSYIQGQQQAVHIPGTLQAPLQSTPFGTASSYLGNTGQFLKGVSAPLGTALPKMQNGLNAVNGGYVAPACGMAGTGGFFGSSSAPGTSIYAGAGLPPTSTSTVDLNTAF